MHAVREDRTSFDSLLSRWSSHCGGGAALEPTTETFRFVNVDTKHQRITNAQIDDYQPLSRREFRWQPPLTMTVRARFSHPAGELSGTAGFGFWNDPFMMTGRLSPALPRALWFFYASPPSDIKLDLAAPGSGWKAATLDAIRLPALTYLPFAPILVPLMRWEAVYRWLWPRVQRALCICEAPLAVDMTKWHTYVLVWEKRAARFLIDGETMLICPSPGGRLGFVMWLDNQSMEVKPWGEFRYRRLDAPGRQWLEVEMFSIVGGKAT
jgi:hypothetical protein